MKRTFGNWVTRFLRGGLVHVRQELRPTRRLPALLKCRQCLLLHQSARSVMDLAYDTAGKSEFP
jgi:hypothetical protein